jgi:hypothetical protein
VYPPLDLILGASDHEALLAQPREKQEAWYAASRLAIENFCGQSFAEEAATLTVEGRGSDRLPLPRRLATLTSVSGFESGDVALSSGHDELVTGSAVADDGGSYGWGHSWIDRLMLGHAGGAFRNGRAYAVEGVWGFTDAEMPTTDADSVLALAMRYDIEEQAESETSELAWTARVASRHGVGGLGEGPLNLQLGGPALPLASRSQALLEPLIWQPPAVVA